jgi:hypothetical protein
MCLTEARWACAAPLIFCKTDNPNGRIRLGLARRIEKREPVLEAVVLGLVTLDAYFEHRRPMLVAIHFFGREMKLTFIVVDGA